MPSLRVSAVLNGMLASYRQLVGIISLFLLIPVYLLFKLSADGDEFRIEVD
jgi:hypothetical protein